MPAPFDRVESEARARLAKALARGTCFATLTAQREGAAAEARIDQAALESIAAAARAAADKAGLAPPTMDGLLALRGVVELVDAGGRRGGRERGLRGRAHEPRRGDRRAHRRAPRRRRGARRAAAAKGSTRSPR